MWCTDNKQMQCSTLRRWQRNVLSACGDWDDNTGPNSGTATFTPKPVAETRLDCGSIMQVWFYSNESKYGARVFMACGF